MWDNTCCLIRDFSTGNAFTYRQESGYSKKTSVTVEIPANGYIKITTDTSSSFLVSFINGLDILMNLKDIIGDVSDYDVNGEYFSKELTKQIVESKVYAEFVKDSDKYAQRLYKNIAKETLISTEAVGNFADTFATNLNELELGKIIAKTAGSFGWSIGEDLFKYFSGPIGAVLDGMFTFNELTDVILQDNDYIKSSGCGAIYIQNQGGGVRSASQIKVESQTDFTDDTALQVFEFYPDTELLEILKKFNPETYESLRNGMTYTYNISMIKNGAESQLENEVTVYIPIPEELKTYSYLGKIKVYRIEEDNTMTELDAEIKNGFLVFKTNHFSLYTITGSDDSTDNYISDVLDYEFETFEDGSATITKYNGTDIKIAVPNTIDGYVVTNIAENAFSDCISLKEIELPDSIKVIGSNAFKNCSNLKAITIPESVTTIGYGAFNNISKYCVIYCYIGSAAEKYAKSNNINFKTLNTVINVKKAKKTLYIKEKTTIKVAITNAVGKTTFNSSNKKVATINENGKVTAKKAGATKITISNNGASKTFKITVKKPILNKKNITLKVGKTSNLKIKGQVGKAKFASSNKKIAKVNSKGLITAKKKGNVTIKVKTNGITLKCKVKVKK